MSKITPEMKDMIEEIVKKVVVDVKAEEDEARRDLLDNLGMAFPGKSDASVEELILEHRKDHEFVRPIRRRAGKWESRLIDSAIWALILFVLGLAAYALGDFKWSWLPTPKG